MTRRDRKPKVGDLIIHHDEVLGEDFTGTVKDLLSVQFTYSVEVDPWTSFIRFCQYSDDWKDYDPTPE